MTTHMYSSVCSFNLTGLTLEEVYEKLDKEISQVQEHLCSLRALRNSLSPISKIPTELLSKIFSHSQEPTDLSFPDDVDLDTRFVASWVCRQWRNTAVRTPGLWTTISMKDRDMPVAMDLAQELLVRSGSLGLFVNLSEPTGDLLEIFVTQMHRIVGMRICNAFRTLEFNGLLSQPAPLLDVLELSYTDTPTEPIFSGIHSNLRGLIVTGVDFLAFRPSILRSLTRLHITRNSRAVDLKYFIHILPTMQSLTELVLAELFQREDFVSPQNRLSLPSLQSVTISDESSCTVFSLLAFLDIPDAEIILSWPETVVCSPTTLAEFYISLGHYRKFVGFPIRHLYIERYLPHFTINISSSPSQHRHSLRFPKQSFQKEDTNAFAYRLPLDSLESISTTELPGTLLKSVKDAYNLSNITLWGTSAVRMFIDHFGLGSGFEMETADLAFTALRELTIGLIKSNHLYGLEEALAARFKLGKELDRLTFVSCPDVDVGRFRNLVGSIVSRFNPMYL